MAARKKRGKSTLVLARQRLADKLPKMPGNYNQGVAYFLGVDASTVAGSVPGRSYAQKISRPGLVEYWEQRLKQAFGV